MSQPTTKPEIEMVDATISPVASRYSDSIASIRATLVFETHGRATGRDERIALARAHRIAADFLEALDAPRYTTPSVEVVQSYAARVDVAISYELATGEQAEADAILALFHDVVPAPEGR